MCGEHDCIDLVKIVRVCVVNMTAEISLKSLAYV
jgi:hypothetical protein